MAFGVELVVALAVRHLSRRSTSADRDTRIGALRLANQLTAVAT
jgi:hypothetical protein